ncbi:MAG: HU family DNA-binding protein [bacterium]
MTKTELAEALAEEAGLTKKKAREAIDSLTEIITDSLTEDEGEKVTIRGFGTFDLSHREERKGVDPQDHDKTIKIPARTVPQFRAGSRLKQAVREAHSE